MPTKKQTPKESTPEPLLGVHVSTAGGLHTAFERAEKLGINTLQLFVKNNKQWFADELKPEAIDQYNTARKIWTTPGPTVAHGCYLLNLASNKPDIIEKSRRSFAEELTRANAVGIDYFVFHPGAHTGLGEEQAIRNIIDALNDIHAETKGFTTKTVFEITAGQGSAVGKNFDELAELVHGVRDAKRVAVCLDTCHMFAAGYDLRDEELWDKTWREFEAKIGYDKLAAIHTNDSKKGLGSRVDRHEHIGEGELGLEAFRLLMNDPRLARIPKILETPKDEAMTEDYHNLATLKALIGRTNTKGVKTQSKRG